MFYRLQKRDRSLKGKIFLSGSKSISNRALIIESLSGSSIEKENLSDSNDTILLQQLLRKESFALSSGETVLDARDAGTVFRFLTAYLSFREGEWILTGSERMQRRPIGQLVDALRKLGAEISYSENTDFPPLKITGGKLNGDFVKVKANISSQFLSALMMIAPCLPNGLTIEVEGNVVSEPYIEMTLSVMKHFGVHHERRENVIHIPPQKYLPKKIFIESDWSAASYFYEMAAFAEDVELELGGLMKDSIQGDSMIAEFMKSFNVFTEFGERKILLTKNSSLTHAPAHFDLANFPDLAPALLVTSAGLSKRFSFPGLAHLIYKESNREEALRNELAKCGITLKNTDGIISLEGNFSAMNPHFNTYNDHRMAMALAPLALVCDAVEIENPVVVNKSYPKFWNDLTTLGFEVEEVK